MSAEVFMQASASLVLQETEQPCAFGWRVHLESYPLNISEDYSVLSCDCRLADERMTA